MTPGSERSSDAGHGTTTRAPRVPDRLTSLRAIARSGRPEAVPEAVYGQYGRYPDEAGRQELAGRAEDAAAVEPAGHRPAVERERHRPAGVQLVERGDLRVEAEPGGGGRGRGAQQLGVRRRIPASCVQICPAGVGEYVELARADPLCRLALADRPARDDDVGIAVGPHRRRPRLELRIALHPDLVPLVEAHDPVGAGRGQQPVGRHLHPDARREQERERQSRACRGGRRRARSGGRPRCPPRRRPRSRGTGRTRAGGRSAPRGSR